MGWAVGASSPSPNPHNSHLHNPPSPMTSHNPPFTTPLSTTRFGAGHMLTLRVPMGKSEPVMAFVAATFPGAELREAHGSRLRFQLPPGGRCTLANVFEELAAHGAEQGVEDFSVNQTTLEEVPKAPGPGWRPRWGWGPGSQADFPSCSLGLPTC